MWNYKIIWRIVKVTIALIVFLLVLNSCDEDSVLVNGKIIASGTSSQIKLNSEVKEAYLGTD